MKNSQNQNGFTLLELLMTIVIVAILAAIALAFYTSYATKAYYSEIVRASSPAKLGVMACYQTLETLTGCSGGQNGVPADITTLASGVASVTTSDGVVTVTPVAQHGILATDTYILTPSVTNGIITWATSGGGVANGYTQ